MYPYTCSLISFWNFTILLEKTKWYLIKQITIAYTLLLNSYDYSASISRSWCIVTPKCTCHILAYSNMFTFLHCNHHPCRQWRDSVICNHCYILCLILLFSVLSDGVFLCSSDNFNVKAYTFKGSISALFSRASLLFKG